MKQGSTRNRICDICSRAAAILSAVAFACFALISLIQTCDVEIGFSFDNNEHVVFLWDNVILNLVVLALLLLLTWLLFHLPVTTKTVYAVMGVMSVLTAVLGVWWVVASNALPNADSLKIIRSAGHLLAGDVQPLRESSYFKVFPFQLGFLLYAEGVMRLLGSANYTAMGILNVAFVLAAYWGVLKLTMRLFDDAHTALLTAILLGLCMQPVFLCTFLYGTLPGLAFAVWSLYFTVVSIREEKPAKLIASGVCIALAILLKNNYMIFLIAECIVLFLHTLRTGRWATLFFMALMIALSLALPRSIQRSYERRLDVSFGEGTPLTAWLVTGLRESSFCSGWFSSYTTTVLQDNDYDLKKTEAQISQDVWERVNLFASRPRYFAAFMYHKLTSQWNEPAYQCIWSSASDARSEPVSPLVESMGTGLAGKRLHAYFNQLMQYVYVGLAVALFGLMKKEHRDDARMLVPIILLGAVLYHALFEAKAQYALIYMPLMLPYAAHAFYTLYKAARSHCPVARHSSAAQ